MTNLERGGPLRPLLCPGFQDPLEKVPEVGHFLRFERTSVASVVSANLMSQVLLAFCVNQLVQASVSFSFYLSFRQCRPPEGTLDPTGAGPWYITNALRSSLVRLGPSDFMTLNSEVIQRGCL